MANSPRPTAGAIHSGRLINSQMNANNAQREERDWTQHSEQWRSTIGFESGAGRNARVGFGESVVNRPNSRTKGPAMGRRLDEGKRQLWERRLAEFRASGSTVTRFCQDAEVSPKTFYYWMRRLNANTTRSQSRAIGQATWPPRCRSSRSDLRSRLWPWLRPISESIALNASKCDSVVTHVPPSQRTAWPLSSV